MKMNNIIAKLQMKNIKNYYLLLFCTVLSVMLVTSYALMYHSPTVQNILPTGGDSRKQANMIFIIALIGCAVFTTYASSLFFRYKSKEFGIFMALGMKKKDLKHILVKELSIMIPVGSLLGLVISLPVSFGIWKIFQLVIIDTKEMDYQIGWFGFLYGIAFCIFVIGCIFTAGAKFIKRSNIMDIIYEQQTSEPISKLKPWVGTVGWLLTLSGIILGYIVPQISYRFLDYRLSSLWNVTFLLTPVGIYMVMLYTVIHIKKGRKIGKYYKNIISTNMMRFSGRQTVKNMCVIAFLTAGALFASFYPAPMFTQSISNVNATPIDYNFYYKETENQINREEIFQLAQKHKVMITSYDEIASLSLVVNGTYVEWGSDNRKIVTPIDKIGYDAFFSESDYNRVSGDQIDVNPGEYMTLVYDLADDYFYEANGSLKLLTQPISDKTEPIQYAGNIAYPPLIVEGNIKHILSDEDYARLAADLPLRNRERFVLFNVADPDMTYSFATELKDEIILRSSAESAVLSSDDDYARKLAQERGEVYFMDEPEMKEDFPVVLSPDNAQLFTNWKYYPSFKVLMEQDLLKNMAVYLMLFIYIAIICFAAVAIIAYTRSITIGMDNQMLFDNLYKLGASNNYIKKVIRKQLVKIFSYPILIGSGTIYIFTLMIFYFNDNKLTIGEIYGLLIDLLIIAVVGFFMYGIYRLSFSKIKHMVFKS